MTQRWSYVALMVGLGIGWGFTQPLGKIAASTGHPAFGLLFWQSVVCVALLGLIAVVRRRGVPLHQGALRFYIVVAFLGTLIPNYTFYTSVAHLPSGIMSIIISTIPMIALPIGLVLGSETVTPRRLTGLLLGLAGVMMLVLPQSSLPDRAMLAFLPVAMIGPLFYALENTYVARTGPCRNGPFAGHAGHANCGFDPVRARHGADRRMDTAAPNPGPARSGACPVIGPACAALRHFRLACRENRCGLCQPVVIYHHSLRHGGRDGSAW